MTSRPPEQQPPQEAHIGDLASGVAFAMEYRRKCRSMADELREHWDTPKRWQIIRDYYKSVEPAILNGARIDPYGLGLGDRMTPIEFALWCEIRYYGLPFYPQYPVGNRFVDFGDPVMQIAIEADGKLFHSPEKDAKKNAELRGHGWRVFRLSGADALYKENVIEPILACYGKRIVVDDE